MNSCLLELMSEFMNSCLLDQLRRQRCVCAAEVDMRRPNSPCHQHSSDNLTAPHHPRRTGPAAQCLRPSPLPQRQSGSLSSAAAMSSELSCQQPSVDSPQTPQLQRAYQGSSGHLCHSQTSLCQQPCPLVLLCKASS